MRVEREAMLLWTGTRVLGVVRHPAGVLEPMRFGAKVRQDAATLLGSSVESAHAGEALKI